MFLLYAMLREIKIETMSGLGQKYIYETSLISYLSSYIDSRFKM